MYREKGDKGGRLSDYISAMRTDRKPAYAESAGKFALGKKAEEPSAEKAESAVEKTAKDASTLTESDALDYTKGGVKVVQGMFEALQKMQETKSDLMAESAAGSAQASIKRAALEGQGMQNPLRQLIAAYRPR